MFWGKSSMNPISHLIIISETKMKLIYNLFGHGFPPNLFGGNAANRDGCRLNKKTLKLEACATHMTHFKGRAVNLTLTALELDYTSHPQQ